MLQHIFAAGTGLDFFSPIGASMTETVLVGAQNGGHVRERMLFSMVE